MRLLIEATVPAKVDPLANLIGQVDAQATETFDR
jgi:hypothetical protein